MSFKAKQIEILKKSKGNKARFFGISHLKIEKTYGDLRDKVKGLRKRR